ncbi:alpha/beta hydrolase [Actinophytocola gossypii]|uniref:DUF1023 domain-containing protein n=1 Tax=Actinophytocola gossypii TaxID=2812003 RepID=A0ABT2J8C5_9PSEU|nr:alpha/beta hydrolase [Actinophytocola gossypii]MCT2584026.1 hypothetical protein [Actinophytocola gossypii]
MVNFAQLNEFEPGVFADAADAWEAHATNLGDQRTALGTEVDSLSDWCGEAAEAARTHFDGLKGNLADSVGLLERIAPALRTAEEEIGGAKRLLDEAIADAGDRFRITADGTVQPSGDLTGDIAGDLTDLQDRIDRAVRQATEADERAASTLRELNPVEIGLGEAVTDAANRDALADFPENGTPEEIRQWWDGLSAIEQESLIHGNSALIGSTDGIPVVARDRANRIVLDEHEAILETQLGQYPEGSGERTRIQDRLAAIELIDERLASDQPDRAYLIHFDAQDVTDRDNPGRFVIATGNPDTADNVVTNVHGINSTVDGNIGTWLEQNDATVDAANRADESESTASIAWYGYDAPIGGEVLDGSYAENAAPDLRRFQEGLRASHDGPPSNNTVLGHSYGSTVVGEAAGSGRLHTDQIAFVGSVGTTVDDASDLRLVTGDGDTVRGDSSTVYAGRTEQDFVGSGLSGMHGNDPMSDDYGAYRFETGTGGDGPSIEYGHTGAYWDREESVDNIGRIVTGDRPVADR